MPTMGSETKPPKSAEQQKSAQFALTRTRRMRGKDYEAGTVLAIVKPMGGFSLDDLRKALAAGQAALDTK